MRKMIAIVLLLTMSFLLCSCGYSESEMRRIKQEAYDDGFLAGTGSSNYDASDDSYDEGYDDGWYAAIHEMEERAKDEEPPVDFAKYVQAQLENVFDSLADYGYYNNEEYVDILNEIYRECNKHLGALGS